MVALRELYWVFRRENWLLDSGSVASRSVACCRVCERQAPAAWRACQLHCPQEAALLVAPRILAGCLPVLVCRVPVDLRCAKRRRGADASLRSATTRDVHRVRIQSCLGSTRPVVKLDALHVSTLPFDLLYLLGAS